MSDQLMCGDVEVSLQTYHLATVLLSLEKLRERGLVAGGVKIDRQMVEAICAVGKRAKLRDMTDEERSDILAVLTDDEDMQELFNDHGIT